MNRLYAAIGIIVVATILVYSSVFVVNERQQAIVLRFGDIHQVISDPGLYFKLPTNFVDTVQLIEDRLLRIDVNDMRIQVSDGKFYVVDAFLVYRISDTRKFRESASGILLRAESLMASRMEAALRAVYGRRGFEAALSDQRAEMMIEARDLLRPDATNLGLSIQDLRIRRTDLTPQVSQQTYDRMSAERLAEAADARARGKEAALRITALADRNVIEIEAAAQRDAEILRGEGDAERNRIFAEAFSRDQEFFEFYRSMRAYETAIENSETTLVLSPDSEFFQYFNNLNPNPSQ